MSLYVCSSCGHLGPITDFQGECAPGWTHGRLTRVSNEEDYVLKTDIMSHESLNAFMAYDEAMCQCEDICKCPGYDVEDE